MGGGVEQNWVADDEATTFDLDDEPNFGDWMFGRIDPGLPKSPSTNELVAAGYRKVFASRREATREVWTSGDLRRHTDKCALHDSLGGGHAYAGIFALRAVDFYTQLWLESLDDREDDRYWAAIDEAAFAFRVGDCVSNVECYWIKER